MVQIVENWSDVAGRVRSVRDAPDLDGWSLVELEVESVDEVAPYAHLVRAAPGDVLEVAVPRERACAAGERVELRVRRGGRGYFAAR